VLIVGISLPLQYYGIHLLSPEKYIKKDISLYDFMKRSFLVSATIKLMIVGIASTIKLMSNWVKSQKKQKKLEKEKLEIALKLRESELKFLKSQINPHFLFNALNNLYGLTLEKSDIAPQIVLKISSLLDYMLHDCNVTLISLEKEIQSLRDYIALQKIRYGEEAKITIDIKGDTKSMKIAPLLLLPFVENAFKHGLTKNLGKGSIKIDIQIANDDFIFSVENDDFSKTDEGKHHGIGLENVQKRLALQYKDSYELKIQKTKGKYKVSLRLINNSITQ
jgi:LytS/YehU family sensor histidine kinase